MLPTDLSARGELARASRLFRPSQSRSSRLSLLVSGSFPDFLIVGAMKAGTTSLHRDLNLHPQIFLPEEKEPEGLCHDRVLSARGRRRYARLFRPSRAGQMRGEASTAYTKLPEWQGVPARARN